MNITTLSHPEIQALELANSRIALESAALESFSDTVKRLVPSIASSVSSFTNSFRAVLQNARGSSTAFYDEREFERALNVLDKHKFTNLIDLRLYTPEGFKGNIATYAAVLLRAQEHADRCVGDVLTPYNVFVSKLVTNPNAARETRLHLADLNKVKAAREFLQAQLAEYFPAGSTSAYCKVGDAVENQGSFKTLNDTLKQINALFDPKKPGQVSAAVKDCSELLDALSNAAHEDSLRDISAQTLRTLGDATLEVAREIEFFSIINYQVNSLLAVMGENAVFWQKALK